MIDFDPIKAAIQRGIVEIIREQRSDGGFISRSSADPKNFSHAVPRLTTFFTSNILSCLSAVSRPRGDAEKAMEKAARFLEREKGQQGSFNYWSRRSKEYKSMPYPDDLDDTFTALSALASYDRRRVDGKVLAEAVKILTALEASEGGPYRTWLVPPDASPRWRDTDIVVNSTIGHFLSLFGVSLPNVGRFIDGALKRNGPVSPYYPGPCQVLYFAARLHRDTKRNDIAKILLQCRKDNVEWNTPLESAMAITSLLRLGFGEKITKEMIGSLAGHIQKGDAHAFPFCIDPAKDGVPYYAGSPALTAAFSAEALSLYLSYGEENATANHNVSNPEAFAVIHKGIQQAAVRECADLESELGVLARNVIERTGDGKITELTYRVRDALGEKGKKIPEEITDRLALGSLYGWMAYTIYDDILDGEKEPLLLPCANVFLRKLAHIYESFGESIPRAREMFDRTMNTIDAANSWEQNHCRIIPESRGISSFKLPDFGDCGNCADRSIGHALSPFSLLGFLGYKPNSREMKTAEQFFRHYFVARQLHDDAHDWSDDLKRGRINAVSALALSGFRKSRGGRQSNASLAELAARMQVFFWNTAIDEAVGLIEAHIRKARRALTHCKALEDISYFDNRLKILEEATKDTLKERDETLRFLKSYGKK